MIALIFCNIIDVFTYFHSLRKNFCFFLNKFERFKTFFTKLSWRWISIILYSSPLDLSSLPLAMAFSTSHFLSYIVSFSRLLPSVFYRLPYFPYALAIEIFSFELSCLLWNNCIFHKFLLSYRSTTNNSLIFGFHHFNLSWNFLFRI